MADEVEKSVTSQCRQTLNLRTMGEDAKDSESMGHGKGLKMQETSNSSSEDDQDSQSKGFGRALQDRPEVPLAVDRDSPDYNMNHKNRGRAIIFAHQKIASTSQSERRGAKIDAELCLKAFKAHGFEVKIHWDLKKEEFHLALEHEQRLDHSENDCLVVVFMSHGGKNGKKEFLCTYDDTVETEELWKYFTPAKCPSLAGKPKLFFIQACRGDGTDRGVLLKDETDSEPINDNNYSREYTIPSYADMLMMWASYPGMYAFRSTQGGLNGSVFIHFLAEVLLEDTKEREELSSKLVRVARRVAVSYESNANEEKDKNKQMPYTVSTLIRRVYFDPK